MRLLRGLGWVVVLSVVLVVGSVVSALTDDAGHEY